MSPGSPRDAARSIEDLDTDVVLSYAEIKAVATGNPLIREQAEVAGELARLARLAANHTKTQRALPGRLAALRDQQQRRTVAVHRLDDLRRPLVDTRGDKFHLVLADGRGYADRGDAGDAIRQLTATLAADGCWRPLGRLAGLDWECCRRRDVISYGYETETVIRIVADTETVSWPTGEFQHGAAPHVLVTRFERHSGRIPDRAAAARHDLQITGEQIERAERNLGQPFPHQSQLEALAARLQTLDAALAASLDQTPAAEPLGPRQPPAAPAPSFDGGISL